MKILAIDSSGLVASIAVIEDNSMIGEYTINYKKTHSQTLLPMLNELIELIDYDLNEIDGIAVSSGPGSFTGLRIGAATAKGLGLALNKQIISVPTVDGLAYNLFGSDAIICPLMDAKRNQVYTGLYRHEEEFEIISPQKAVMLDEIIDEINQLKQRVIFLGDGVPVYREQLKERLQVSYTFAPAHLSRQRAGAIGLLAESYLKLGLTESARDHKPVYLRMSQAERELLEKNKRAEGK